ncbi:hypothetical protein KIH41_16295 [Litoribacter ruber]|uniref:hypothetical protein n=1 Tax=Litoribacter ruber TaxID=702568 RepID=UPI001BDA094B|nr:hypothetical protein [Litoribacter ruber]MBT0812848.1 hypothetical protein [Litoribacter ruber]
MANRRRAVVYAQDIMTMTGRSRSYAYKVLREIKVFYNKPKSHLVTIEEYVGFHGIPAQKVLEYLYEVIAD